MIKCTRLFYAFPRHLPAPGKAQERGLHLRRRGRPGHPADAHGHGSDDLKETASRMTGDGLRDSKFS